MKKTLLITFLATITSIVFTGCTSSMPSIESLKNSSVEDFLEGQGFSWDGKDEIYKIKGTKNKKFDKDDSLSMDFKDYYNKRFIDYCNSQGGKIENPDAWQNRVFPISEISSKANTLVYSKLNANIKNWEKVSKLCSIHDIPLFGYSFVKSSDITSEGVIKEQFNVQEYNYNTLYKLAYDTGKEANIWNNMESFVVLIKSQDYQEAQLFISSYLEHNNFEEDKKSQKTTIPRDENYVTPSSGFRRF